MTENKKLIIKEKRTSNRRMKPYLYSLLVIDFLMIVLVDKFLQDLVYLGLVLLAIGLTIFLGYLIFFTKNRIFTLDLDGIYVDDCLFRWED